MTDPTAGCDEHGVVSEELRLLALALLDRFEPGLQSVLAGLRVEAAEAAAAGASPAAATCQWCPLCSLAALLRGDRPELAGRLAEQVGGLLVTLREVLGEPAGTPDDGAANSQRDESRTVQHIEVRPAGPSGAGAGC